MRSVIQINKLIDIIKESLSEAANLEELVASAGAIEALLWVIGQPSAMDTSYAMALNRDNN